MFRVSLALLLAMIGTAVACGEEDTLSMTVDEHATVEDYAAACKRLGHKFDELDGSDGYFSSGFEVLEDALAELNGWNPPEELREFHRVRLRGTESTVDALRDSGFLELIQVLEKAYEEEDVGKVLSLLGEMLKLKDALSQLEDEMSQFSDEAERAQERLSPATRRILEEADCI